MIAITDLRDCVEQVYYHVWEKSAPFAYFPDGYYLDIRPWITYDFDTYHEDYDSQFGLGLYEDCHEDENFYKAILNNAYNTANEWSKDGKRAFIGGFTMHVTKVDGDHVYIEWDSYDNYKKTVEINGNKKVKEF